jgi:hypothetical protein
MSSASRSARARRSRARATALRRAASTASRAPQNAAKAASMPAPKAAPCRKTGQIDAAGTEPGTAIEAVCKIECTSYGSSPSLQSAPDTTQAPAMPASRTLAPSQLVDAALTPVVYRFGYFFQKVQEKEVYYGQSGIFRAYPSHRLQPTGTMTELNPSPTLGTGFATPCGSGRGDTTGQFWRPMAP